MTSDIVELRDPEDFPALYRTVDSMSTDAQESALLAVKVRLGALLVATVGGLVTWSVSDVSSGAVVSLVAFLVALAAELYTGVARPEKQWYEGRAAAESIKTLTWRYAVAGESFDTSEGDPDSKFLADIRDVLHDLESLDVQPRDTPGVQISDGMRKARSQGFHDRKNLYLTGRIDDQFQWYSRKAEWNSTRAKRWLIASIVFEVAGIFFAALQAFASFPLDFMGLLAAIAATITGWVQLKQHRNLATAYGVTAHELAAIASETKALEDESTWAKFVGQAEEAISREHTLWRASRGLKIRH